MSLNIYKSVSLLPLLPRVEINADTSLWPTFDEAPLRYSYLEVPLRDFKNCSMIFVRWIYTGAPITEAGHNVGAQIYDKIGTKKIQVCSSAQVNMAAGDKLNASVVFTNSTSFFATTSYAANSIQRDIQNNLTGYYTTAETDVAGVTNSVVVTPVQNLLPFGDNATMVLTYQRVIPFVNEFLNPLNIVISGNNI